LGGGVAYGFDYLTKRPEDIRSGITFDAMVLDNASCGIEYVDDGKTDDEHLEVLYELLDLL
jgi:hypothetical protein